MMSIYPSFRVFSALLATVLMLQGCPGQEQPEPDDDSADDDTADEPPGGQINADESLDFNFVTVGEPSEASIEIRNTANQRLLITDIIIAGTNNEDFTTDFDDEVSLVADPAISYTLNVTFTPTVADAEQASLMIVSSAINSGPGNPFTITLTGAGYSDNDGDEHYYGATYTEPDADCNDDDPLINPTATEICDGIDNDCDGGIDNVPDADGDGIAICDPYPDCDDADPDAHPVWVDPTAIGGNGSQANPFGTLEDAFASDHCGIILLTAGSYYEGHAVEIDSGPVSVISVDGALSAEINGGNTHALFSVISGPVTFQDILFQHGYSPDSGGAISSYADIILDHCALYYNVSDGGSGAMQTYEANVTITNSHFFMNSGFLAGGLLSDAGGADTHTHISATLFVGNSSYYGGGLNLEGGSAVLDSTGYFLNTANICGGVVLQNMNNVDIDNCEFQNNVAENIEDGVCGGIGIVDSSNIHINNTTISDNDADKAGGLIISNSAGSISDCDFTNNSAVTRGAGAFFERAYFTLNDTIFRGNTAGDDGGAIYGHNESDITLSRSLFELNTALSGGAIYLEDSVSSINNSIFNANSGNGAALYLAGGTQNIDQCTFYDNRPISGSATLFLDSDPNTLILTSTIFAENDEFTIDCVGTAADWNYNDFHPSIGDFSFSHTCSTTGLGNIEVDPDFAAATANLDPSDDSLWLLVASPCIDTGDPACTENDSTRCDMGAYGGPESL